MHFYVATRARRELSSTQFEMKRKNDPSRNFKARGVSLPPDLDAFAIKKSGKDLDVTFSKYVQRLIRMDMEQTLLAPIRN